MPPKIKIAKADIITAAVELVREKGTGALNARNVGAALGCSTQPVFSNFENMEQLRTEVIRSAEERCGAFINQEQADGRYPAYKATGMAYIRFAREEKELFRLLYMRDRGKERISTDMDPALSTMVQKSTGLERSAAELFHLEMWAFVHGIASMVATGYLDFEQELISRMLTDAYQGLRKHYEQEA